jgi:hypothetical protein
MIRTRKESLTRIPHIRTVDLLKCPGCKTEIPDRSVFCMSCGRPIKEEGLEPIQPPSGSQTETKSTMLLMFAIMVLFFGIFLLLPAFFIWSIVFLLVCTALIVAGVLMLVARYLVLRKYAKKVEEFREEAAEKKRCKYCGKMNSLDADECSSCNAPL